MSTARDRYAFGGLVALPALVVLLAYTTPRSSSTQLLVLFAMAFIAYAFICWRAQFVGLKLVLLLSIGLRVLLLLAPVALTDDHFRYLWDGLCSNHVISPYAHTPRELFVVHGDLFPATLFAALNSPDFHTAYPPVAQAVFACATWIGSGDVHTSTIALRGIIIFVEWASLLLLYLLSRDRSPIALALYGLNPLVLVELTGNLHTEALMIAPCLAAVLMIHRGKNMAAGALIGVAAAARLWPLVFILALPVVLGWKRGLLPSVLAVLVFGLSWCPFITEGLAEHFFGSLMLFSNHLEFNGGLYELLRQVRHGALVKGTGVLGLITIAGLLVYDGVRWRIGARDFMGTLLWLTAIVLFGSQVVHPWYITPLVAFAALTTWRWPVWWSLLIVPTYLTYRSLPFGQPYWWLVIEYTVLVIILVLEIRLRPHPSGT